MAYIRAISAPGGAIDFSKVPDVEYINGTAGTSGTATISVSQKPRLILIEIFSRSSTYAGQMGYIDVEANTAIRTGYYGSAGNHGFEDWTNWTNYITSITDSQVVYNFAAWANAHRVYIGIFY